MMTDPERYGCVILSKNTLPLELVFQDGRVMTPDEAKYPECWQSVSLEQFDPY
jgi:hypothetical protein